MHPLNFGQDRPRTIADDTDKRDQNSGRAKRARFQATEHAFAFGGERHAGGGHHIIGIQALGGIAEGALGEVSNNLQRIRELAIQSRNATNSSSDRDALQAEVAQLKSEVQRVAEQTTFNGLNLLDGSFTSQAFQVGSNQGDTINVDSIVNSQIDSLGTWNSVASANTTGASGAYTDVVLADGNTYSLTVGGVEVFNRLEAGGGSTVSAADIDGGVTDGTVQTNLAAAGITVSGSAADGTLAFTKTDGAAIDVVVANTGTGAGFAGADFATGTNAVDNGAASEAQTGFADLDISTVEGADNAILAMDAALAAVNSGRADLGAIQNRFSSVVANLQTTSENLTASRSRIMDTDFAKETAELTRAQILQQAGTAMLSQANSAPQAVLSLLR